MKKFYYHIVSHNSVLLSTLPIQMYGFAETCECGYKRNYSEVLKRNIVQIKEAIDDGYLYICSDDQTITRKILQYYFDALKTLYPSHEDSISKIKESTVKDFRRLQHNVSTYNAAIKDELENLGNYILVGSNIQLEYKYAK